MLVRHRNRALELLEQAGAFQASFGPDLTKAFRKKMQFLRAIQSEQDLRNMKSLRFEKLKGDRAHQHSIRLNDQWRLILQFEGEGNGRTAVVIAIEDYH